MSDQTWRIVTPEAVALDLEAAGLASRVMAAVIDVIVLSVLLNVVSLVAVVLAGLLGGSGPVAAVVVLVGGFAGLVAWPATLETLTHGRSVGKMALGLRVVTVEGAPIQFRHALVRGLLGFVELFATFGSVALLVAMGSRRFRRLGDHLAGTVVIREGSGTPSARAVRFFPLPGWEGFADALDVSRLTPAHHRVVRSYLLRADSLAADTRIRLGGEILDRVATTIALPPAVRERLNPLDPVPPLTAVAAAYQRRFSPDPIFLPWLPYAPLMPADAVPPFGR